VNPLNPYVPPPPLNSLGDALALVRLALNPKEAAEYIERLAAQTIAYQESHQKLVSQSKDIENRLKAVEIAEAQLAPKISALTAREGATADLSRQLDSQREELNTRRSALDEAEKALAQSRISLEAQRKNFEQTSASRIVELDNREQALKEREAAHNAKVQRLRELV
jgi:chromosome segregation ATPase